jgi:hypothetical protein
MIKFDTYKHAFPHAKLTRSAEGTLEVVLHTDGDTLVFNGHTREEFYRERKKVLANLIDTPDTVFQDEPHLCFGIVPGDGIHSLLPHVIGSLRGRYFSVTQQKPSAEEARAPGAVNEIVGRGRPLQRAREIAAGIAKLPPLTASYTRVALTQPLRRLVDGSVGYGLALEGISAADIAQAGAAR